MKPASILRRIIAFTLIPILFVGIILSAPKAYAGGKKKKEAKTEMVIVEHPDQPAKYKKGEAAMYEDISKVMYYPASAAEANQTGTVWVQFVVDLKGKTSDFKLNRSSGNEALDEEAVRASKKAFKSGWIPGQHNGEPVVSIFYIPLKFKLI